MADGKDCKDADAKASKAVQQQQACQGMMETALKKGACLHWGIA